MENGKYKKYKKENAQKLSREINEIDNQIDNLIYNLYELTEKNKIVVENS